jgi:nucleotide-binding universal stress UspA family protein
MTIACGTDFSENAGAAARAAGAIAARLAAPLELVHVVDASGARDSVDALRARLSAQAEGLRREFGIEVRVTIEYGVADERLVEIAISLHARLVVVASLGQRQQHRWLLGSVAERVVQAAPMPVLVVRDAASIEAWARGERALRVMVGVEPTPSAKAALDWADNLRDVGPCERIVVQIAWPAEEQHRIGIPAPIPLDHLRPELEQVLLRALEQWAGDPPRPGDRSFIVKPGWGRVDGHLTQLAAESKVDLLVVGTHQRAGIARLWQGSVSRGVLHGAAMSVACVPLRGAGDERVRSTP